MCLSLHTVKAGKITVFQGHQFTFKKIVFGKNLFHEDFGAIQVVHKHRTRHN